MAKTLTLNSASRTSRSEARHKAKLKVLAEPETISALTSTAALPTVKAIGAALRSKVRVLSAAKLALALSTPPTKRRKF